jgi:hypothetical protein
MTLETQWVEKCAEFLQERMSSRFSHRMPHLGVIGAPFPEQIREVQNKDDTESDVLTILEEQKESASFRYTPNTIQVEFFIKGDGNLIFQTSFFFRKKDGTHSLPRGHEYNKDEDTEFFSKAEIKITYNIKEDKIGGELLIDGSEQKLEIKKVDESISERFILIIKQNSEPFVHIKDVTKTPKPYIYTIRIDLKVTSINNDNLRIKYKFSNQSAAGLAGHLREGISDDDYIYYYGPFYEFNTKISLNGVTIKETEDGRRISKINNLIYNELGNEIFLRDSRIISETIA